MMSTGRGGGYGLDAELAAKAAAQYDHEGEAKAQEWIETLTGKKFEGTFAQGLKNGTLLCELLNAIKPGTIKKINNSAMPFKQMENISNFLKGCRSLGVSEHSLFETVDLYEEKDVNLVIRCLFALDSMVQSTVPEFEGPHIAVKHGAANKREFTEEQKLKARLNAAITKQNEGSSAVMERVPITKTGITVGAEYAGTGDTSSISMANKGSYGIMDRSPIKKSGITVGAEYAGTGDTSTISMANKGSYGIMDRSHIQKSGITFNADHAGPSLDSTVPYSSMGSAGIMERPHNAKIGITSGADYAGPSVNSNTVSQANLGSYGIMERGNIPNSNITKGADFAGPSAAQQHN